VTLDLFGRGPPGSREAAERRARTEALVPGRSRDAPLSPSTLNGLAREVLETGFSSLWVAGEVTNWRRVSAGHCYFTLRDASAQLPCVMFASQARRLPADPENGMEVRVLGALTLYETRGAYQLRAEMLEAAGGDGLWRLAFERLRVRLQEDGLLEPGRKRALPRCPSRVGVVTSPAGAALHDILRVIAERAPWTEVVFCPARVQGDGAAEDIARALGTVGRAAGVEVVIVGRGGGSTEDLWAFNEEVVARAISASPVPVVSAVGHEVDVTIADLVADVRAPTPSAAGEIVVPDRVALAREVEDASTRLARALRHYVRARRARLALLAERARGAASRRLRERRERLGRLSAQLDALSPLGALARGYAVPLGAEGRVLRSAEEFVPALPFRLRVVDGEVDCRVVD
jgi:exodeoxyribonuclease VII large subunit